MNEARQSNVDAGREAMYSMNAQLEAEARRAADKRLAQESATKQVEELVQKNAKLHEELDAAKAECAELKKTLEQAQGGHQMLLTTVRTLAKLVP